MSNGVLRMGGIAFVASGVLFLTHGLLQFLMGPPPSTGSEIIGWAASHPIPAAYIPEVLFFAAALMAPAIVALYVTLARTHPTQAALGCGVMAATVPVFFGALVPFGRFAYPIFDLTANTADLAVFAVLLYFGNLHATALLLGFATFVVSLGMRRSEFGGTIAYLGYVTAALEVLSGYPDLIGATLMLVAALFLAAWFVAVGAQLFHVTLLTTSPGKGNGPKMGLNERFV